VNSFDVVILLCLAVCAALGIRAGLTRGGAMFVCLLLGVAAASSIYKQFTIGIIGRDWVPLQTEHFCTILGIAILVGLGIAAFLKGTTGDSGRNAMDLSLGALSGLLYGLAFVSVAISLSAAYQERVPLLAGSLLARNLLWTTSWTADMAPGELKDAILSGLQTIQSGSAN